MAMKIGDMATKSVVRIKINGSPYDFKILYQGKPTSGNYDDSCDGTWLIMDTPYGLMPYGTSQIFSNTELFDTLNSGFYNSIEAGARNVIKRARIPYSSSPTEVKSGADGLQCHVFLLSALEAGYTDGNFNAEGTNLGYFTTNSERVASYNGEPVVWGLRTLDKTSTQNVIAVNTDGSQVSKPITEQVGLRPVFIVYSSCYVDDDFNLVPDIAPVITSSVGESGTNLGKRNESFAFTYTVTTSRPDLTLAIDEILSGTDVSKTREVVASPQSGVQRTFSVVVDDPDDFYKLMNGEKTLTVRAYYSDYNVAGVNSEAEFFVTFEKYVNEATITLKTPLSVEGSITKGIITLEGNIPDDATLQVQATNNAKDSSPVWIDVTNYVQTNSEFTFSNSTAANGPAFNFKVYVKRGASDESGYIAAIVGAFE